MNKRQESQYRATARFHERMAAEYAKRGDAVNAAAAHRANWLGRATCLYFRLNADAMNYTTLSHRAQRAARIMPLLKAAMEVRS